MLKFWKAKQAKPDSQRPTLRQIWRREETQAASGQGRWVAKADCPPWLNVAGRLYRTEDGSVHRAHMFPLPHRVQAWYFPPQGEPTK